MSLELGLQTLTDPAVTAILTSLLIGWVLVAAEPALSRLTRDRNDLDAVQASHTGEVLRLGGVAIFGGVLAGALVLSGTTDISFTMLLLLTALPVLMAGLAEDLGYPVSPRGRLMAAAISAAACVLILGLWVPRADLPGIDLLMTFMPLAIVLTVLGAAGFCHAVNLIDGMNGLAAFTALVAAAGLSAIAYQAGEPEISLFAMLLGAACLGFLAWNWPLGRLFLGDAGSYGIGHLLAWLAIALVMLAPAVAFAAVVLVLFWPLADTLHTILRRFLARQRIAEPDKMHLHQKIRRCLEVVWFGSNRRELTNPLATLVMAPIIALPVATGVILWNQAVAAYVALAFFALAFGGLHLMIMRLATLYRRARWPFSALNRRQDAVASPDSLNPPLIAVRVDSDYSGMFIQDGLAVDVRIFRYAKDTHWTLETYDGVNPPVQWSQQFDTERAAWDAFMRAVREDTMDTLARGYQVRPR
ncbi:MraY family glycosyltransferase [Alkalilimnicola ehrlichii MLHE-1]|uniref:Glycosyl transferase, family 4 n=1 Tax=Alkalilimnicola ehrlichii (strain ATCC BAA-1101 / DSM 17681 / MLHE-1) TaxID=187272 RepID=Q0A655_ALKEH|nr:glycosyltransferase [Alkalilimnicola ehrlichii]ABI57682.1 glycosyl transferase, family 4 [Alkalilimnicola ehrlichii MLHE-1]